MSKRVDKRVGINYLLYESLQIRVKYCQEKCSFQYPIYWGLLQYIQCSISNENPSVRVEWRIPKLDISIIFECIVSSSSWVLNIIVGPYTVSAI
jgi:hypothetical protein